MSERVGQLYEDVDDFERLLSDAQSQAKTERDQEFIAEMVRKFDEWGAEMFLSTPQREWIERIVG